MQTTTIFLAYHEQHEDEDLLSLYGVAVSVINSTKQVEEALRQTIRLNFRAGRNDTNCTALLVGLARVIPIEVIVPFALKPVPIGINYEQLHAIMANECKTMKSDCYCYNSESGELFYVSLDDLGNPQDAILSKEEARWQ